MIYKLLPAAEWAAAERRGHFDGSGIDLRDGYVHLSAEDQVGETAARYFAEESDLMLLAVDERRLGDALRWELSRGDALFPHLYGALPLRAVVAAYPVPGDLPVASAVASLLTGDSRDPAV